MFSLQQVRKTYTKHGTTVEALRPTDLEVAGGEYVALVGHSGSGKSTLLSILGGMLAPTSGTVLVDGKPLYSLSATERARLRRERIGFVFQSFNLIPYLTALENVQVPLVLQGTDPAVQRQVAGELLERLGLGERRHHKPCELSVGQQQRVALARTLANDPGIILADEPTGNLDPATREDVLAIFDRFHAEGRTVLVVTHDPAVAARAGRTLRLSDGSVSAVSDPIGPRLRAAA